MTTLLLEAVENLTVSTENPHNDVSVDDFRAENGSVLANPGDDEVPNPVLSLTSADLYDEVLRRLRQAGDSWD